MSYRTIDSPFYLIWTIYIPILLLCGLLFWLHPACLLKVLSYGILSILILCLMFALPISYRPLGHPLACRVRLGRWLQLMLHQLGFLCLYVTLWALHQTMDVNPPRVSNMLPKDTLTISFLWMWLMGLTWAFSYLRYVQQCLPIVSQALAPWSSDKPLLIFSINFYIRQAIYTSYGTCWMLFTIWGCLYAMDGLHIPYQWGMNIHLVIGWLLLLAFILSKTWLQWIRRLTAYHLPLGVIHLLAALGTVLFFISMQYLYQMYQIPDYQSWFAQPQSWLPLVTLGQQYFAYALLVGLGLLWAWQMASYCQGLTLLDIIGALSILPLGWMLYLNLSPDLYLNALWEPWLVLGSIFYLMVGLSWSKAVKTLFFNHTYMFGVADKDRNTTLALQGLLLTTLFGPMIWFAGGKSWYSFLVYLLATPALFIAVVMIVALIWKEHIYRGKSAHENPS